MSIEEIRVEAQRFHNKIRRRNIREYVAFALAAIIFSAYTVYLKVPMLRVASVLIVAGTFVGAYQLYKRATSRALPSDMALTSCITFTSWSAGGDGPSG